MIEQTCLYKRWKSVLAKLPGDPGILHTFASVRSTVSEQSKIIIHVFPEYTPHDATRHLEQLFTLADRVLGADLFDRLNAAEMSLLAFGLYTHDWGMAVGSDEREIIHGKRASQDTDLLPAEVASFQTFRDEAVRIGKTDQQAWEDYLRETHARRSGQRLRKELKPLGHPFAEMAARVAEGHVLDIRELRDPEQYPLQIALFGEVANVAAIATYVRLVDLLDIAEDRTPFALWSIVRPRNEISRTEWSKHRALAPVAATEHSGIRKILITGTTDDLDVFAALADLRSWVDSQFAESVGFLRNIGGKFDVPLDSTIAWDIVPVNFRPVLMRFEFDRSASLGLLSAEVYGDRRLTFVRELLQNSVDAIDTRVEVLRGSDTILQGRISVRVSTLPELIRIEWTDNGVGMDRYILENYLTKIGRSWYQSPDFRRRALTNDPISKFGIGLLSCFAASTSLTIMTRREPRLAKDSIGWHVRIPARDGYFRVKEVDNLSIGTTVVLEIPRTGTDMTTGQLATVVKKTAALVKYAVVLHTDDLVEVFEPVADDKDSRLPYIQIDCLDETHLNYLRSETIQLNHRYLATDGSYEAFFSCILPRDLNSLTYAGYSKWTLGSKIVDFEDFIVTRPPQLFVKGIESQEQRAWRERGTLTSCALNILKPSLVRPDLSRSHIGLGSINPVGVWKDAAAKIRDAIKLDSRSLDSRVRALSYASRVARLPPDSLNGLVPYDEWPIWTLQRESGLVWRDSSAVLGDAELLEAPDELRYVLEQGDYQQSILQSIGSWSGPTCIVILRQDSTGPWHNGAASLAKLLLENNGFTRSGVRFFASHSSDRVPLTCCVWRKQPAPARSPESLPLADLLLAWRKDPNVAYPEIVERLLGAEGRVRVSMAPLLLPLPESMGEVAAVGSLYWNQNHPKIRALVETLFELSTRLVRGGLSGRAQQVFSYLNGTDYLGYQAPSRHSGIRAAVDRFAGLLGVAKDEGLPVPKSLEVGDFLPGSVGTYQNPYHYPVWSWPKSNRPVGTTLDAKPKAQP